MSEFYLPYQFVPATADIKETTPFEKVEKGETNARHDKWLPNALSGRIVCRLTLETPTFVGAKQTRESENKAAFIEPYLRDKKRAIPANSLRGMISSIAETLSQSSLRVLNDHYYSVRKPIENSLSAIGLLRTSKVDSKKLELIPLTLPTLESKDKRFFKLENKWLKIFENRPLAECLTIYVDGYEFRKYQNKETLIYKRNSFLEQNKPKCFSWNDPNKEFYAIPKPLPVLYHNKVESNVPYNLIGLNILGKNYLIGQLFSNANEPRELNSIGDQISPNEIKGFFRVLGIENEKATTIPSRKKHELFIPFPTKVNVLTISEEAEQRFQRMAKERSEDSEEKLPFLLKGYENIYPDFYKNPQLQAGMIVFFDVEEQENGLPIVSELSLSSNWRKEVGTNRDYFEKISPDLLPFNPDRNNLTPAELLFGFIEEGKQKEAKSSRALASRVRFSDGLLHEKNIAFIEDEKIVTLKILGSPKPPSPALYFGQGTYIKKTDLNPEIHRPNGRKFYLHHPQSQIEKEFWKVDPENVEEKTLKMRLQCQPMTQAEFWFHLDFNNLSNAELTLLLKSLHPSNEFRHKLGLGKSLGLGSVKIDVMGVFGIDRSTRYSVNALNEETRYHWGYQINQENITWHGFYGVEYQERRLENYCFTPDYSLIDNKKARLILNKIGDRSAILGSKYWVHNPLTTRQKPAPERQAQATEQYKFEHETFKWFGENSRLRTGQQALGRIKENEPLPTLKTIDEHN